MTGLSSGPTMTLADVYATTRVHHIAGRTGDRTALVTTRPWRARPQSLSAVG
jgi:hypothetical protein